MSSSNATPSTTSPIKAVQLDGLVVLRILHHAKEHTPDIVTGQLLGLDSPPVLEITSSFPLPNATAEGVDENYQLDYMKMLRDVNVDSNSVGWYQNGSFPTVLDSTWIDHQYEFQKYIPESVCVILESSSLSNQRIQLRAFRLSNAFMEAYEKSNGKYGFSADLLTKYDLDGTTIIEDIPIRIHNSHLVHGFLYEYREQKELHSTFDSLSLSHSASIEKALTTLSSQVEDLVVEQTRYTIYQRMCARQKVAQQTFLSKRAQDNEIRALQGKEEIKEDLSKHPLFRPLAKPQRLDALLLTQQLRYMTTDIKEYSKNALSRLYVGDAFHKEVDESD
jgi:translation initiation factor 3 subunit H